MLSILVEAIIIYNPSELNSQNLAFDIECGKMISCKFLFLNMTIPYPTITVMIPSGLAVIS